MQGARLTFSRQFQVLQERLLAAKERHMLLQSAITETRSLVLQVDRKASRLH